MSQYIHIYNIYFTYIYIYTLYYILYYVIYLYYVICLISKSFCQLTDAVEYNCLINPPLE